jgi:iron complex outermembrane receptor protein
MTRLLLLCLCFLSLFATEAPPPTGTGVVRGTVTLSENGSPMRHATVMLTPLGKITETNDNGEYEFRGVPAGEYGVISHMHALVDEKKVAKVIDGGTVVVDFKLQLSPLRDSVTVTASGKEETVMEAFQSVTSLEGYQLAAKSSSTSLGDLLENETGIAKRSFGPGTTRPVVRGFDGDRVLILQDGMRSGTLSSQSGDHGEPVDSSNIEKVEVVRGPATLLYGSNAIGGVVNVLTDHHIINQHPHDGLHMTLNATGGTGNAQGGGSGSFEYGNGSWMVYGSGGGMRTSDYNTPIGKVLNSATEMTNSKFGVGRYGDRFSFNANFQNYETTYGIPAASTDDEMPILNMTRKAGRFNGALKQLGGGFEQFEYDLSYTDYTHKEIVDGQIGTQFFNKQFNYRGVFDQKKKGHLTGSLGYWGMHRDYKALGDEALTPPVTQNAFALFALEEYSLERVRFQFGGRLEHNAYNPTGLAARSFTGGSGSAGVYLPTWTNGALVVNYMHSYRAPALEELYNHGPHPGNLAYEIGDANLKPEKSNGVEVSLRHQAQRLKLELNAFRYHMNDYVYFAPTGEVEDGLGVFEYKQATTRYQGVEGKAQFKLVNTLWLNTGFDYVDANLTSGDRQNLPRIPPARGRLGLDWFWKGFSVRPEVVLVNKQWQIAPNETTTAGYAAMNLNASYTLTGKHLMQTFSVNTFNLGDRLYRNHLSFIKDFAPEMGRGVRFGYTVQWF